MSFSIKHVLLTGSIGAVLMFQVNCAPAEPVKPVASKATVSRKTASTDLSKVPNDLSNVPKQEKPFWKNAQTFVDAYAKRDSAAIGMLFTRDAEFYDEFKERTVGREAIVKLFQEVFDNTPDALVDEINIERVRFITDRVALEEGAVTTTDFPGGPREVNRYIALHVKGKDGLWRINTLKDYARENDTRVEQLNQLSWMLGEWVSEDSSSVVHTNCQWSKDGNYLLRQFTVKIAGQPIMEGVQRIGWDPLRKQLRSWIFDSEGGFIEGEWKRIGSRWIVISNGVNSDGKSSSGVAIYTVHDAERVSWQYRNRIVGNELHEDIKPVVMTRRPPAPQAAN